MQGVNIAVVGATGLVGTVFLSILEERHFPARSLKLFASARSAGKRVPVGDRTYVVEEVTGAESFRGMDIVFISADTGVSKRLAPLAVQAGAVVIDDSSAFRMEPDVPLVVPEVNAADLRGHRGIIAIPNCSTTPLVMVLHALRQAAAIERVVAATYQSVSGTGRAAVEELMEQSRAALEGRDIAPKAYLHPIAFNVLPQIDDFLENGYTKEEWKMVTETRKILHLPDLALSATCVRVPVKVCHSEAVQVELSKPVSPEEARALLAKMPGVRVLDEPERNEYPMPRLLAGTDNVYVGRIRKDASHPRGLAMWVVADNLRKGAALNAIQIAEELIKQGAFQAKSASTGSARAV
ncbi:MAG: aspartate-semialdehyde dehydrogenase [Dehalococcoidia bacterium]|nr:aspartate-semialdehyde dehydrogenase [Dehalococcoidia bacterium]